MAGALDGEQVSLSNLSRVCGGPYPGSKKERAEPGRRPIRLPGYLMIHHASSTGIIRLRRPPLAVPKSSRKSSSAARLLDFE
jgi:hypothetical protein